MIDELSTRYCEIDEKSMTEFNKFKRLQREYETQKQKYIWEERARVKEQKKISKKLESLKNEIYDDTYQIKINQLIDEYEELESSQDPWVINYIKEWKKEREEKEQNQDN